MLILNSVVLGLLQRCDSGTSAKCPCPSLASYQVDLCRSPYTATEVVCFEFMATWRDFVISSCLADFDKTLKDSVDVAAQALSGLVYKNNCAGGRGSGRVSGSRRAFTAQGEQDRT